TFVYVGTTLRILLPQPGSEFRPGAYALRLWAWQNGSIYYSESNFNWGVLVVNFNKSIYTLGDNATIGKASITTDITAPSGIVYHLTTSDKSITRNKTCGPQTITNEPDYSAKFT